MPSPMRRYTFRPYRTGPYFILCTWETNRRDWRGCSRIRYRLAMREKGRSTVLFAGNDYSPGPAYAIDSIGAAEGLMCFLTLQPGDTDAKYFKRYTPEQLEYCAHHAEALSCEVASRWCDEDGNLKKRYRR